MSKPTVGCILGLFAVLLLAGCQREAQSPSPPSPSSILAAPAGSSVRILSVDPPTSVALRVGDKVTLKLDVQYVLAAESGTVAIVVQAANNSPLAQNVSVIRNGSGKLNLQAEFVVPQTNAVQVFVPLHAQGQGPTSTVDSRAFEVVAK